MENASASANTPVLGEDSPLLSLGNLSLNLWNYRAVVADLPVELTYQEFELLRLLARSADRIVSFDALTRGLWQTTGHRETRRLNVLAFRLRSKLAASHPYHIETVRGRGYGLVTAVGKEPVANAS